MHVKKDREASWDEVRKSQKEVKAHMRAVNVIFNIGGNSDQDRVWDANELQSTVIPPVGVLPKDHKPLEESGDPKTRPVCYANKTING